MARKPAPPDTPEDFEPGDGLSPPSDEGTPTHWHEGPIDPPKYRTPMEDPAHPLHHLRNT
jgi:hypothetical protein